MKRSLIAAAVAACSLSASLAQATVISTAYTSLGGDAWLADFNILNDGSPMAFAGFTVDLPSATNLVLLGSPATWDTWAAQADTGLQDDASLDSSVFLPADALAVGQSVGGFRVSFNYAAGMLPGAMPFIVYDADYTTLAMGMTTVTAVPEPATTLLAALGLGVLGLRTAQARRRQCQDGGVAA